MKLQIWHYVGYLLGLFFALEPSYIHPDEHFQSIEILMGKIQGIAGNIPWEFEPANSARSFVPLYLAYGPLLYLNKWLLHIQSPTAILYLLRIQNYIVFVFVSKLALQFLLQSKKERSKADFFISTSYIVWCYQTHTFSNSLETVILLITLSLFKTLIQDSRDSKYQHYRTSVLIGFFICLGIFNRITFPAFILLPCIPTMHKFYWHHWRSSMVCLFSFGLTSYLFVVADTWLYNSNTWCVAPLNNFSYNMDESNLATHGLHPRYTHILFNVPQMLGPTLIFFFSRRYKLALPLLSCVSGLVTLSLFKHQELRFLVPLLPLFCISIDLSNFDKVIKSEHVIKLWLLFNICLGIVMGGLHQRGVILAIDHLRTSSDTAGVHVWWKTYSPPTWMYMNKNLTISTTNFVDGVENVDKVDFNILQNHVIDLKGCSVSLLKKTLSRLAESGSRDVLVIAPKSITNKIYGLENTSTFHFNSTWETKYSLDMDHFDIGDFTTFTPGMTIYEVTAEA